MNEDTRGSRAEERGDTHETPEQLELLESREEQVTSALQRIDALESRVKGAEASAREHAAAAEAATRLLQEQVVSLAAAEANAREATARNHELFRQLDEATRPPAWRRSVKGVRRILRPYACVLEAELLPPGELAARGGGPTWLRLKPRAGRLAAGWVLVDLEIQDVDGEPLSPRLYADDGSGRAEESLTPLPEIVGGRCHGVVKLPDRVTDLYLDPRVEAGRYRLGSMRVRELSRVEAASRLAAPLLGQTLRSPSRLVGAAHTAYDVYRSQGWAVLKRRFRDEAFSRNVPRDYAAWIREHDTLTAADRDLVGQRAAALSEKLGFTVVLLVSREDDPEDVQASLRSIDAQLFQRWTGIVAGSEEIEHVEHLRGLLADRSRWRWPPLGSGAELSARVEEPLVAFVRPGDVLAPHALYVLAEAFSQHPGTDVVYPDEDALEAGHRASPWFKPDWSPYRLWCQDYIRHRFACRAEFLRRIGLQDSLDGEPLFELLLEASRSQAQVRHAPFALYHVRGDPRRDLPAARRVLEQHLARVAPGASVGAGRLAETFRVRLALPPQPPTVSIIIPTRNRAKLLRRCIETLRAHTDYPSYEIVVVDNDSDEPEARRYLEKLEAQGHARVLRYPGEFNFAAINNFAARQARGSLLALLNNDIEIPDRGWLVEMVSWALREDVGAVGCRLRYGDGRIQHAGVFLGFQGLAGHLHKGLGPDEPGYGGAAWVMREVGAVTAACLVMRRELFDELRGMDESLRVAFNDVDLCLRIREQDRVVVFTPFADLVHLESASRGDDAAPEHLARTASEAEQVRRQHGPLALVDPYYSLNLSLESTSAEPAFPPRVRKPWRFATADRRKIAFLAYRLMKGYGVDVVVAEQIEFFCARGYDVTAIVLERDGTYDIRLSAYILAGQLRILRVRSPEEGIAQAVALGIEVAVAHTPPFHGALLRLPVSMCRVLFDHGEPPARFFPDADRRRRIAADKVATSHQVDLSVAISEFVRRDSGLWEPRVCGNGNDHMLRRRSNLTRLVGTFREEHRLGDAFVVLNVTRYLADERRYKGVEEYAAVRDALVRARPELADRVRFVIAGRSEAADRAWAERRGLLALSNLTDDQLLAAYLDSDAYLSTSQWEGYNLGIAQALALGVPTFASSRGAHPEFPIRTSDDPQELAGWLVDEAGRMASRRPTPVRRLRDAVVSPWKASAARLEALVREGLERGGCPAGKMPRPVPGRGDGPAPEVSFLILNKDKPELIVPCVRSIEEHCDVPYEIFIGDTGSTDPGTLEFYESTPHQVHYLGFYNFSACNNILAARARGRYVLFLNNDTALIRTRFREALDYLRTHDDVGCLGGYLVYADHRIQHAGVRICPQAPYRGIPEHFDKLKPIDGYPGLQRPREVVAVTGAMLLVAADRFRSADGFDEVYEEEAQDIDLCLRLRRQGLRMVVHPALYAYHYENSTRTVKEAPRDRAEFLSRFGKVIEEDLYGWQAKVGLG